MSRRIVVEEPCSLHDEIDCRRYVCDHPDDGKPHDLGHGVCKVCPGGSRQVLTEIPDEWVERAARAEYDVDRFSFGTIEDGGYRPNWFHEAEEVRNEYRATALAALEAAVFGETR